ncbi:MAG: hypothetical protein U5L07_18070 [Desulfobacterales bacterium]|nr:hypothetical protein [Desulfobacterales bacterium]
MHQGTVVPAEKTRIFLKLPIGERRVQPLVQKDGGVVGDKKRIMFKHIVAEN